MIKLIVAVDRGNSIGWSDGRLPWRLPNDMKRFKELTTGCPVVMGFNTWVSLKRPTGLPNRKNIILTRKPYSEAREHFSASADVDIISSLDYIDQLNSRRSADQPPIWIIGGASVYEDAVRRNLVDQFHITLVDDSSGGDVRLMTDFAAWKLWTIREAKAGRQWHIDKTLPERDGDFYTSYLTITRLS